MTLIGLLCAQENCPCRYNNMLFSNTGNMAFVPAAPEDNDLPPSFPSVFPTSCAPHQEFQGISSVLMRRAMSFDHQDSQAGDIDMSDDDGSSQLLGEKKRRLNLEQVKALERSFEIGNKLEPERKMQLARALGLKPRQIAIWFQNRRARCKTKQLEKDYEILKRQCDKIKADNDALKTQNKKLHSELQLTLRNRESAGGTPILFNLNKENEGSNWNNGSGDENGTIIDVNLGTTTRTSSTNSPHNNHDVFPTANFKIEQTVPGEGFFNMFTNVEDQTNFWPLPVQQHFY